MFQVWRARDGDQRRGGAFQFEHLFVRVTRWRLVMAVLGACTYLLGLVIFLPAEAIAGRGRDAVGTVWNGQMALAAQSANSGFVLGWKVRPWASLLGAAGVADVEVTGPETLIRGRVHARPGGLIIRSANGQGSMRLLNAALPALPFACDGQMQISAENLAPQGGARGTGRLTTGPATCVASEGAEQGRAMTSVEPLTAQLGSGADGGSAVVTGPDGAQLAQARLARNGSLNLKVEPAAQGLLPGVVPLSLDTRL